MCTTFAFYNTIPKKMQINQSIQEVAYYAITTFSTYEKQYSYVLTRCKDNTILINQALQSANNRFNMEVAELQFEIVKELVFLQLFRVIND